MNDSGHGVIAAIYGAVAADSPARPDTNSAPGRDLEAFSDAFEEAGTAWAPALESLCAVLGACGARLVLEPLLAPALTSEAPSEDVDAEACGPDCVGAWVDDAESVGVQTIAAVGRLPRCIDARGRDGHVLRLTLPPHEGARLRLYVVRDEHEAPFEARALAFAEQIAGHIERAYRLGPLRTDPGRLRLRGFEARGVPALLVDGQARLVALNPSAHTFIADAGLNWRQGEAVDFEHEASGDAFGVAVRESLRLGNRRIFVPLGGPTELHTGALVVAPLQRRAVFEDAETTQTPGRGLALVTIARRDRPGALAASQLRELFGLTPTESRVAASIASGCSPEITAERYDLAIGTVRWHLKRVFAKTSCSGQTELVAQLQALAHTL